MLRVVAHLDDNLLGQMIDSNVLVFQSQRLLQVGPQILQTAIYLA